MKPTWNGTKNEIDSKWNGKLKKKNFRIGIFNEKSVRNEMKSMNPDVGPREGLNNIKMSLKLKPKTELKMKLEYKT